MAGRGNFEKYFEKCTLGPNMREAGSIRRRIRRDRCRAAKRQDVVGRALVESRKIGQHAAV